MKQYCIFCNHGLDTNRDPHQHFDVVVHRDVYAPFCSGSCAVSFCKYTLGLLGLEQQMKYLEEAYNLRINDLKLIKPTLKLSTKDAQDCSHYKSKCPDSAKHDLSTSRDQDDDKSGQTNQRTPGVYDKFLQDRIGHHVNDFFSLDSLIAS